MFPYGFLASITRRHFASKSVTDNIYQSRPYFKRAQKQNRVMFPGGTEIVEPLIVGAEPNVQPIAQGTIIPMTVGAPFNSAKYLMKRYAAQLLLPKEQILQNSGMEAVVALIDARKQNLEMTLNDMIGTDAIQSSGTGSSILNIEGLLNLIDDMTSSGGFGPADFANWASQVVRTQQTIATSNKPINDLFLSCIVSASMPTLAITTVTIFGQVWQNTQQQQRWINEDQASVGYTAIGFNQRPLTFDAGMPANNFLWVNEAFMKVHVHKDDNFETINIPVLQDQDAALWRTTASLCPTTNNRRMHGKHTNLITT